MKTVDNPNWGNMAKNLIKEYNPFGFTLKDGSGLIHASVYEAYSNFLLHVWMDFPRGYIEMPLLIIANYRHLSYKDAVRLVKTFKPMGVEMIEKFPGYASTEAKESLERICRALCTITGCGFNESAFKGAYTLLMNRIENEKEKSNKNGKSEQ